MDKCTSIFYLYPKKVELIFLEKIELDSTSSLAYLFIIRVRRRLFFKSFSGDEAGLDPYKICQECIAYVLIIHTNNYI